ncbi:MAG: OsmC family peroxiredoxin [Halobacteriales archaeon]|nr:OsmC family peroxiredoxin [Halobacteriales archaeon]
MPSRTSTATWEGDLQTGNGSMTIGDGVYEGAFTFASRFERGEGTNPEELIAAAHAGCFAMALSNELASDGYDPQEVNTSATVHLEDGAISQIDLEVEATIPDIDEETFHEYANGAKENCPVSQALAAVPEVTLSATLV